VTPTPPPGPAEINTKQALTKISIQSIFLAKPVSIQFNSMILFFKLQKIMTSMLHMKNEKLEHQSPRRHEYGNRAVYE